MASTINATTSSGIVATADNTGSLALQSAGTTSATFNTYGMGLGSAVPSSGIGITFPAAQSASTDANTLDDYEEGTFTPIDSSGAGLTFTFPTGAYTKIGNMVFAQARFIYPSTASGLTAEVGGFPFAAATSGIYYGAYIVYQTYGTVLQSRSYNPTTVLLSVAGGSNVTNANLSGIQIQLVYVYRATA